LRTCTAEARDGPARHEKRESLPIKTRIFLLVTWMVAALFATVTLPGTRSAAGAPGEGALSCPFSDPYRALQSAVARLNANIAVGDHYTLDRVIVEDRWAYGLAYRLDYSGLRIPYSHAVPLALADANGGWCALAPGVARAADYNRALAAFPSSLFDEATVAMLQQTDAEAGLDNFVGYRLPWPGGQYAYVTQRDGLYHQNQVDFDILGWGSSGVVIASRPGRVVFVKESSNTGYCDFDYWQWANMVVIQHADAEYSWYVHLAYNSVPVSLGQWVEFGTPIGIEGATGYACGVHLHYMASTGHTAWTNPENPALAPWGLDVTAVDFYESPWLGLIPPYSYVSQNYLAAYHVYLPVTVQPGSID
jgi:murein DD-endopeptidase MepM/ murein hydrolase activator NlpD